MILCKWENLPEHLQTAEIKPYYDYLNQHKMYLLLKRCFDIIFSLLLLVLFLPLFIIVALAIKIDSPGPVFFRQQRVTQYGKLFNIFKFRSMVDRADLGPSLTIGDDKRITRVGKIIRKLRIDEFSQLLNILQGTMTFVGTRPEIPKYVQHYTPEMKATLLLPAGVTSKASILYKDEDQILAESINYDKSYIEDILPQKMKYNLQALKTSNFITDLHIILSTIIAVFKGGE